MAIEIDPINYGEIKGTLNTFIESQRIHNEKVEAKLDSIDGRMRDVEKKAAISGMVSGGIISLAVAFTSYVITKGRF